MEDLNKNQLILLTLLVSFVTSIATGIITTSLLQEAPPGVTQVINRVVEKTIEKVGEDGKVQTVKEVTVVVKEEDQVINSISKNTKSIVRIKDNALVDGVTPFYGAGFLVTKEGLVVSARRDILNPNSTYTATFADGSSFSMTVVGIDEPNKLAFFKIAKDPKLSIQADPVTIGTAQTQLGQSIVALDGQEKNTVSIGRVTGLPQTQSEPKDIIAIETDISSQATVLGMPLINLSGEIVGIRNEVNTTSSQSFVPALAIRKGINQYGQK